MELAFYTGWAWDLIWLMLGMAAGVAIMLVGWTIQDNIKRATVILVGFVVSTGFGVECAYTVGRIYGWV
jgi:hypothetical protein